MSSLWVIKHIPWVTLYEWRQLLKSMSQLFASECKVTSELYHVSVSVHVHLFCLCVYVSVCRWIVSVNFINTYNVFSICGCDIYYIIYVIKFSGYSWKTTRPLLEETMDDSYHVDFLLTYRTFLTSPGEIIT